MTLFASDTPRASAGRARKASVIDMYVDFCMPTLYPIAKSHALARVYNRLMTWCDATFSQVNARIWFLPKNTQMYAIPHEKRPQTAMSAGVKRC